MDRKNEVRIEDCTPPALPIPDTMLEDHITLTAAELGYAIVSRVPGDEWGDEDPRLEWRPDDSVCLSPLAWFPPNADKIPGFADDRRLEREYREISEVLRVILAPYGWTWHGGVFCPPQPRQAAEERQAIARKGAAARLAQVKAKKEGNTDS